MQGSIPSGPALVTGASGFIGAAVVRALIARGYPVRAIIRPGSDRSNLEDLAAEVVEADVRDAGALRGAVHGSSWVFHLAALYRFGRRYERESQQVNVEGTRNLLEAAQRAGCQRVVYTSTVGTLGLPEAGASGDEASPARLYQLAGAYKGSKYIAEHEALRFAAQGLPVVLVHPTFPVGIGDRSPTPSGKVILDFLNGRLPAYVNTGLNVADVDDVAEGHILAAQRGRPGASYILGGENLTLRDVLTKLARRTGLAPPRLRLSPQLLLPLAYVSEWVEGWALGREPSIPLEALQMSRRRMFFDDARARRELGYRSAPADVALGKAVTWYLERGFVRAGRARRIVQDRSLPPQPLPEGAAVPSIPSAPAAPRDVPDAHRSAPS